MGELKEPLSQDAESQARLGLVEMGGKGELPVWLEWGMCVGCKRI